MINSSPAATGQEFGSGYIDGRFQINATYKTIPIATLLTYNPGLPPPGSPEGSPPIASSFTQSFGNANYNIRETLYGLFVQDNWAMTPNFTWNLGLRYDGQTFTQQYSMFSPRLGLPGACRIHPIQCCAADTASTTRRNVPTCMPALPWRPARGYSPTPSRRAGWVSDFLRAYLRVPARRQLPARDITILAGQCGYLNQFLPVSNCVIARIPL